MAVAGALPVLCFVVALALCPWQGKTGIEELEGLLVAFARGKRIFLERVN